MATHRMVAGGQIGAAITQLAGLAAGLMVLVLAIPLQGQLPADELGAQGTMAFNVIWNSVLPGAVFANSITGLHPGEQRYSGRAALRLRPGLYLGASVGSWQFNFVRFKSSTAISSMSDAVNISPYVQLYPLRHARVFVRAGAGWVNTWSYDGGGFDIQGYKANRLSVTAGVGADFPFRSHLALTLSGDYTKVIGAKNYAEAESAVLLGVGPTIR